MLPCRFISWSSHIESFIGTAEVREHFCRALLVWGNVSEFSRVESFSSRSLSFCSMIKVRSLPICINSSISSFICDCLSWEFSSSKLEKREGEIGGCSGVLCDGRRLDVVKAGDAVVD